MLALFKLIREPETPPPWGLLSAGLVLIVAFVFMTLVGASVGVALSAPTSSAAFVIGWGVGSVLVIALIWQTRRTPEARAALRLGAARPPLLIAFGVGLGAGVTFDLLAIAAAQEVLRPPELAAFSEATGGIAWVWGALLLLLLQPVAEELLFRGVMFPALRAMQGVWAAILMSALLYGIYHLLIYPHPAPGAAGLWYGLAEPLLAGVMLGVMRAAWRSNRATIAAHAGLGAFALLKTLLILSGVT